MELIEKKDNQIIFKTEISESLANAIRRYMNEIPVLAIDEVEISKNDSPLYDETIAHRLGLVVLKTDKTAGGKTTTNFKLNVKKDGMVYSGELSPAKVVYDKIPITLLNKGQELQLVAITRMGKGIEHSKFSPGFLFYRDSVNAEEETDSKEKVLSLESFGQLTVKDIFAKSIDALKKDLVSVSKKIK